jgi:hypothetical protein
MATTTFEHTATRRVVTAGIVRVVIVALTLATAAIHGSLGGVLFTVNAIGYAGLALAMVLPGPIGRIRWLIRLALIGFTLVTIGGWVAFGARFSLAYLDKAIEVALVVVTGFDLWHADGNPIVIAGRLRRLPSTVVRTLVSRA